MRKQTAVKRDERGRILDTNGEPLKGGLPCPHCGRVLFYDAGTEPPATCIGCEKPLEGADAP